MSSKVKAIAGILHMSVELFLSIVSILISAISVYFVYVLLNLIVKKDANSAVVIGYNPAIYDVGGVVYYQLKALEAE